jgi:hypothetical protein
MKGNLGTFSSNVLIKKLYPLAKLLSQNKVAPSYLKGLMPSRRYVLETALGVMRSTGPLEQVLIYIGRHDL